MYRYVQIAKQTLPALQELKAAGLVRHIGITGLPLSIFPKVLNASGDAAPDVVLSYCHYCLNDSSLLEVLPALEERGVGVINASCLSMGLLTQSGPPDWHPAPQQLREAAAAATACAAGRGVDIARLALMWAIKVRATQFRWFVLLSSCLGQCIILLFMLHGSLPSVDASLAEIPRKLVLGDQFGLRIGINAIAKVERHPIARLHACSHCRWQVHQIVACRCTAELVTQQYAQRTSAVSGCSPSSCVLCRAERCSIAPSCILHHAF